MTDIPIINLQIPDDSIQWLTGFWEGDGYITHFQSYSTRVIIGFEQKDPEVLSSLQHILQDYSLGSFKPVSWGGYRLAYSSKPFCIALLKAFANYIVSPKSISKLARAYELLQLPGLADIESRDITWPWLAGFWDAEGFSTLTGHTCSWRNLLIGFGQKETYSLEKIQKFIQAGTIHESSKRETNQYGPEGATCNSLRISTPLDSILICQLKKYSRNQGKLAKLQDDIVASELSHTIMHHIQDPKNNPIEEEPQ